MEYERRLAAILSADVAGFSRLTGADEEGTMQRLRELRIPAVNPPVRAHRGRIIKEMGDGILAEFPSAVDAVRCSLEVQRAVAARNGEIIPDKRLEFRIGIHVGDVMIQPNGDVLGDTVNIAARLETIAQPGGVCVSEDAYRQVRDRLKEKFVDLNEQHLKNIARPMRVYAIQIAASAAGKRPATAKAKPPSSRQARHPSAEQLRLPSPVHVRAPNTRLTIDTVTNAMNSSIKTCHLKPPDYRDGLLPAPCWWRRCGQGK
jgi:adenylate cyclase